MIIKAQRSGFCVGCIPDLVKNGVAVLQYANEQSRTHTHASSGNPDSASALLRVPSGQGVSVQTCRGLSNLLTIFDI
jgi:hypothetical protein